MDVLTVHVLKTQEYFIIEKLYLGASLTLAVLCPSHTHLKNN